MKNKFLMFLILLEATSAFASKGRLQNEDSRSLAEIQSSTLSTTGNLTLSNACISSIGSTSGLATGQFIYDSTNPSYITAGTTIAGLPGTCAAGQVQMSTTANHAATGDTITFGGQMSQLLNDTKIYVTANGVNTQLSSAITNNTLISGGSGMRGLCQLNDAVVPYVNVSGPIYVVATLSLSSVYISMLNSGSSGSTVIQLNQYRSGALQATATASLSASSGNSATTTASLSGTLSLLAGDMVTCDVNSIAGGSPEALGIQW